MAAAPTKEAILSLYSTTLRTARSFSSYNFRNYFVGRAKDTFRNMQAEQDSARVSAAYQHAVKELAVLRRGAIVNQLYGGWRLAVEEQGAEGENTDNTIRERGEN